MKFNSPIDIIFLFLLLSRIFIKLNKMCSSCICVNGEWNKNESKVNFFFLFCYLNGSITAIITVCLPSFFFFLLLIIVYCTYTKKKTAKKKIAKANMGKVEQQREENC